MKDGELGRVYGDGEIIFSEGEKGDTMYVIQSGKVNIRKSIGSEDVTIATLHSGDIMGEMALFDLMPRSATALASGDARVLSIDKKKLFSTISRDPTLVFKILESMSRRIRRLNEDLTNLKQDKFGILQACLDVKQSCSIVLEEAKNIIYADSGSVMLLDEGSGKFSIVAAFGSEAEPKTDLSAGEGIAGDVLRTGRAELVNNASLDPRFKPGKAAVKSMLCVPLRCKSRTGGVINMSNSSDRLFTVDDLKMLHTLSVYAAVAIENARNFSDLRHATDEILRHATILDM